MTNDLEVLEAQALKLSVADRSRLLERVLASLDLDPDVEAAWDEVADVREGALETQQVTAVPLDEAIARLEARFPGPGVFALQGPPVVFIAAVSSRGDLPADRRWHLDPGRAPSPPSPGTRPAAQLNQKAPRRSVRAPAASR